MYWYMMTTTSSQVLLSDEVWSQIPRTSADRRVVGAALVVLVLLVPALIMGNATGILVPRLTYEGGSSTVDARAHTITIAAVIHNESARSWKITGATVDAPGTARVIRTAPVEIPAHQRRTVRGVAHVDNCAAVPPGPSDQFYGFDGDVKLRVQRLFDTTTFTINTVLDKDLIAMACRP